MNFKVLKSSDPSILYSTDWSELKGKKSHNIWILRMGQFCVHFTCFTLHFTLLCNPTSIISLIPNSSGFMKYLLHVHNKVLEKKVWPFCSAFLEVNRNKWQFFFDKFVPLLSFLLTVFFSSICITTSFFYLTLLIQVITQFLNQFSRF